MDHGAGTEWEIDMKLEAGMAAVVTGAASGLGEATARMLAESKF
jgi:NADP-dependent 3-hydroxy acid dehydrogenase YdfG